MIPSADLQLLFARQQQTSAVVQAREIITQGKTEFTASCAIARVELLKSLGLIAALSD